MAGDGQQRAPSARSPGLTWAHVPRRVPGRLPSGFVRPRGHRDLPTAPAAPPLLRHPSSSFSLSSSPGGDVDEGGAAAGQPPAARRLRKAGKEAPPNEREVPGVGGGRGSMRLHHAKVPSKVVGSVRATATARPPDRWQSRLSWPGATWASSPSPASRWRTAGLDSGPPTSRTSTAPRPSPSNPEVACSANEGTDFRSPTRKWITKSEL